MLCTQCRGIGPHLSASGKSDCFSRVAAGSWGMISSYGGEHCSNLVFVQRRQDFCLVTRDTSGISSSFGRAMQTVLEVSWEDQCTFLVAKVILGFLSIFNKNQGSSTFEALCSPCLLRCQTDVRPPFQMSWGPRVFPRASTGDSDVPSFVR